MGRSSARSCPQECRSVTRTECQVFRAVIGRVKLSKKGLVKAIDLTVQICTRDPASSTMAGKATSFSEVKHIRVGQWKNRGSTTVISHASACGALTDAAPVQRAACCDPRGRTSEAEMSSFEQLGALSAVKLRTLLLMWK